MKLAKKTLMIALLWALIAGNPASAVVDQFDFQLDLESQIVAPPSGGTGYDNGTWYFYPNTGWWNQWFYNAPFDPTRWKEIDLDIPAVAPVDPCQPSALELVINWSTPEWSALGLDHPPLPGDVIDPADEDLYIKRSAPIFIDLLFGPTPITTLPDPFIIPDYNPEWVSIDVTGINVETLIPGTIDHRCVPEPATIGLIAMGVLALIRKRRS